MFLCTVVYDYDSIPNLPKLEAKCHFNIMSTRHRAKAQMTSDWKDIPQLGGSQDRQALASKPKNPTREGMTLVQWITTMCVMAFL